MLSSVTDYILWLLGTALPTFFSSEPILILFSLLCFSFVVGIVCRFFRPPKI